VKCGECEHWLEIGQGRGECLKLASTKPDGPVFLSDSVTVFVSPEFGCALGEPDEKFSRRRLIYSEVPDQGGHLEAVAALDETRGKWRVDDLLERGKADYVVLLEAVVVEEHGESSVEGGSLMADDSGLTDNDGDRHGVRERTGDRRGRDVEARRGGGT